MEQILQLTAATLRDGSISYVDNNGIIWESTNTTLQDYNTHLSQQLQLESTKLTSLFLFPHNSLLSFEWSSVVELDITTYELLLYIGLSIACVILGGVTSGLNVSLLSIDEQKLELLSRTASPKRIRMCKKLSPIVADHHLLLVTILLANASAMEALPIFLDNLVTPVVAVIISVTFVLIFGEIIPQALFSSDPILVGSKLAWLVRSFQLFIFPIAKPIAFLLDKCIPQRHAVYYTQKEISAIVEMADFEHPDQKMFIRMSIHVCVYSHCLVVK